MKKMICFLSAVLIVIFSAGCKNKAQTASSEPAVNKADVTVSVPTAQIPESDSEDPINFQPDLGGGTAVKTEDLYHESGKANGIDVSKWQGKIDWAKVKKSGIDFAVIRIGYRGENGIIYKDSAADYNLQQAEKAGILTGVYFFSTAVTVKEAQEEAAFTVSAIAGYPISYPVVYDCEGFSLSESRMYNVTSAGRTDNALAFINYVNQKGYEGMLYAAKNELLRQDYDTARLKNVKIWLAQYTSPAYPKTPKPDYSGAYDMWQYTNLGSVSGIDGNVDMSVAYFTKTKAEPKNAAARPKNAEEPKAQDNIYKEANDTVTAKELVNLREKAGTNYKIVGSVKNGDFLKRTGIGSNGWSRLIYNGKTVYAVTSFLTTDKNYKPPTVDTSSASDGFTAADGKLTAKEETNLRDKPSTSGNVVVTIKNGEFVTRTGVNTATGWTRLIYNGKTVYAVTSLLTTEVKKPEVSSSSVPKPDDGFIAADGKFTAKEETNLRSVPGSTDSSTVVYALKRGEFVVRTGVNHSTNWTRLTFNGQTVYARSDLLMSEEDWNTLNKAEE